jgi:hypothetical protein
MTNLHSHPILPHTTAAIVRAIESGAGIDGSCGEVFSHRRPAIGLYRVPLATILTLSRLGIIERGPHGTWWKARSWKPQA